MLARPAARHGFNDSVRGSVENMMARWVFRFVALFVGRKAWEVYQRRRAVDSAARPQRR